MAQRVIVVPALHPKLSGNRRRDMDMGDVASNSEEAEALLIQQAQLLLDTAFDGILISRDGVVVGVSDSLLSVSGYGRDDLIGRPLTDFVAEEYRVAVAERAQLESEGWLDAVAVCSDGRKLDIELVTKNYVVGGNPCRITALRDVTEKRRMEERLWQAHRLEALGRIVGGVSHDFKNLLLVIRGYGEVLLEDLGEPYRNDVQEIVNAAESGITLVRQLMDYSRPRRPELRPIHINGVVRASEPMVRRLLGADVVLETHLAPDAGQIFADANQLQHVILNLAINARDAMPGGGRLVISTGNVRVNESEASNHGRARPGMYAMLAIRDSGTGMPSDVKAQIFEPYFTTKERDSGTGLGLAAVQSVVQRSRGFIVVDSTVGAGSSFSIHFPIVDS
jgi:two-component system cell cycle sensor histidine kinase/response regulator CckA